MAGALWTPEAGAEGTGIRMHVMVDGAGMSSGERLDAYNAVSTSLALRSDRALDEHVDGAAPLGSGIRGRSALPKECDCLPVRRRP
ncbi:hypothetical protein [Streptomyces atroolivaceus]|uniref:hypothetical protein n=1 Tax=Streptomyces atroolivaceus TaxID=66869 RepID=UPI0036C58B1E